MLTQRFEIGQQFKTSGKHPRLCVVIDVLKTYNSAGELVELAYLAEHSLLGQVMSERVHDTTIARGMIPGVRPRNPRS
jgi:hypothetical protein